MQGWQAPESKEEGNPNLMEVGRLGAAVRCTVYGVIGEMAPSGGEVPAAPLHLLCPSCRYSHPVPRRSWCEPAMSHWSSVTAAPSGAEGNRPGGKAVREGEGCWDISTVP